MPHFLRILTPRRILAGAFVGLAATGAALWACDVWVSRAAAGRCHQQTQAMPAAPVAVVMGCSPKTRGEPNRFYHARIQAGAALFKAGKVQALIVSGDNATKEYDEPTAMKADLAAAGVPEDRIYCDYAGFRTLDSVVRAQAVFGQSRFIVVSQRFHNERAIFLARRHGLDVTGFDAADVSRTMAPATYLREYLARVKAVLDVTLLSTEPKFYGPPVKIDLPAS